jgi:hypothetical protein
MTGAVLLSAFVCTCADTIHREVKATFHNAQRRILNLQPGMRISIRNDGSTAFRKQTGL